MNSLIIGNGSISEALENNMCSKGIFVEVISFRTFFKNYYYKSFDFQRFDRIFFVGIDKSNLLKNLLNTFFLIKQLNKKSWKGCFYFFFQRNKQSRYSMIKMAKEFLLTRDIMVGLSFSNHQL